MRIENRTIYFDNLIDNETGKVLTRELKPYEDVEEVKRRLNIIGRRACEDGERFKKMFSEE